MPSLWEELLPRHPVIEVLAAPRRTYSNFIHGMRSDASPHPDAVAHVNQGRIRIGKFCTLMKH